MNEKMERENQMKDLTVGQRSCARADEMVAYIYGEANQAEAAEFLSHARDCSTCRTEMAEFAQIRQSLGGWREEMLSSLVPLKSSAEAGHLRDTAQREPARRRSAFAAIREFLTLSPGWMRGATAFATLLFCALLVLTFVHFFQRPEPQIIYVKENSGKVYTRQEADAMIADAVARERQSWQNKSQEQQIASTASGPDNTPTPRRPQRRTAFETQSMMARSNGGPPARRSVTKAEREQVAEVLLPQDSDESVPRLSDLLGDADDPD
jgi:hypothetical protein